MRGQRLSPSLTGKRSDLRVPWGPLGFIGQDYPSVCSAWVQLGGWGGVCDVCTCPEALGGPRTPGESVEVEGRDWVRGPLLRTR